MANYIQAGGFDGTINDQYWTGTGTIDRSLGYPRLGCVQLTAGQSLAQTVGLSADQLHTAHLFYRPGDGASLTVTYGSISQTFDAGTASQWNEAVMVFALDASANDALTLSASGGTVYVDSVSLVGGLPVSRGALAVTVAARLGGLATDASLTTTPSASGPNGSYSAAIDEALRSLGAVNSWGDPDITALDYGQVNDATEAAVTALLQTLRSTYALRTDVSLGPRRESFSQIAESIDAMLSGSGPDRRIKVMPLLRKNGWQR